MVPSAFFSHYAVYGNDGKLDQKSTVSAFAKELADWADQANNIKPAILEVLKEVPTKALGEGRLIDFVTFHLRMEPSKENREMIAAAIVELERAGRITYSQDEQGEKRSRGRGAGWSLAETPRTEVPPPAAPRTSKAPRASARA